MSVSAPARRSRSLGVIVGALLVLAVGAAPVVAQQESPTPADPRASGSPPVYDDRAIPAIPMPGSIVDPQPVGWDHVTIWPDGRTLTVYFWNGAEACFGLDHLELTDLGGTLSITPWVGFRADASNLRCVAIEQLYSTALTLKTPILGGGTPGIDGAQEPMGGLLAQPGAELSTMEPGPWDQVDLGPDGQTGWVFFVGGDRACYGVGKVGVTDVDGLPVLSVYTGPLVMAPQVCDLIAVFLRAPFSLDAPLLLGGAA